MIKKIIIALSNLKGIGRKSIYKFLMQNRTTLEQNDFDEKELIELILKFVKSNKRSAYLEMTDIKNALYNSEKIIQNHLNQGIEIITIFDEYYPKNFLSLESDAPVIIYAKGNMELLKKKKFLAVIGSRQISEYASKVGVRLAELLAEQDEIIVSGLAIGSDTCGHEGALNAKNGHTIAILPNGLDTIVPSSNSKLVEQMIRSGSLLLTEYPIGTRADKGKFVERDRLQAGLANGIVVLETSIDGGTMHAVNIAFNQKKPIACLPENMVKLSGNKLLVDNYSASTIATKNDINEFVKKVDSTIVQNKTTLSDNAKKISSDKCKQISLF